MIVANVRARLGPGDLRLVLLALARGDRRRRAAYERLLAAEGPDRLLDDPELLDGLLAVRSLVVPSPPLFTYVAVRHVLRAAGVDSRELADYLAALLLEFGDHGRHERIHAHDDETYRYLVDLVSDLRTAGEARGAERVFFLLAHLGNYSLWLSGLFPDYVAAQRLRRGGPDFRYYDELGRRGYSLAAEHALAARFGVVAIYRTAAERFPTVRVALNRLSDRVFFPNVCTQDKVARNL